MTRYYCCFVIIIGGVAVVIICRSNSTVHGEERPQENSNSVKIIILVLKSCL